MRIRIRLAWFKPGARLQLAVRWTLGLGCLAALFFYLDPQKLASTLGRTNWALAGPVVIGLVAMHLVGAAIWKMLAARLSGAHWRWGYIIRAYYAGQATGSITPSNIGGDVYRVYATTGGDQSWQRAALPIAAQRIASYLALLLLGTAATVFVPSPVALTIALWVATAALCLVVVAYWVLTRESPSPDSLSGRLIARLRLQSWRAVPGCRLWPAFINALLLQLLFHAGSVALGYVLFLSIGGQAAMLPALSAIVLARLAILLPFSIGGLGFQEGALAALFPMVGLSSEMGLAVSVLNRLAFLATLALGAALIFMGRKTVGQESRSRPRASNHIPTETVS